MAKHNPLLVHPVLRRKVYPYTNPLIHLDLQDVGNAMKYLEHFKCHGDQG